MRALWAAAFSLAIIGLPAQPASDTTKLIQEADRLAWLRAWSAAEPLYAEAEKLFSARGDQRNALYAQISALRGQLPRLPVSEVSARLAEYLEHPLLQADDRLRLRCLIIKGETDEDLDPTLAGESWREAQALAEKLGDAAWANRAKGELGLVAFLQGDVGASVIGLGQALKVAQSNGDVSSQVRWLTLFGHGYVQLGRPAEALDFYDRALKVASAVPELQFPMMSYVGRSNALVKLGRFDDADEILNQATEIAAKHEARGYQAQLLTQQALIADQRKQPDRALALLAQAMDLARAAGGNRIVAEIALDAAKIQRARNQLPAAERTLRAGIEIARSMEERLLLPRLLAELADLRSSQRRYTEAASILEEATDLMEGFFTTASSPWVQSRLVSGMDEVFLARIRLEGMRGQDLARMFSVVEQARGRSLLQLLVNRPLSAQRKPQELRDGERQIATLQRRLLRTTDRAARQRLLDQIFTAEERLAPISTTLFDRTRRAGPRTPIALRDLQRALGPDEVFIEFALADPQAEHAVDMETGAIVGVTVQGADQGDTTTIAETVTTAAEELEAVATVTDDATTVIDEVVADKGYHSNQVLVDLAALDLRTYIAEPDRGRRNWRRKAAARDAVYANRRRIRGTRGRALQRRRSEHLERPNAHLYETGAMRRTHLRGHANILKRLLVHIGGFNLGLLMRTLVGVGTPRGLQGRLSSLMALIVARLIDLVAHVRDDAPPLDCEPRFRPHHDFPLLPVRLSAGAL